MGPPKLHWIQVDQHSSEWDLTLDWIHNKFDLNQRNIYHDHTKTMNFFFYFWKKDCIYDIEETPYKTPTAQKKYKDQTVDSCKDQKDETVEKEALKHWCTPFAALTWLRT